MTLLDPIQKNIEHHALIPDGTKVVVGVSGGADSVALLRALHQLDHPLVVAHLNHMLRGEESDLDEQFVRDLADELGLPMISKSVDARQLADDTGGSLEMAARQARHDFFAEFGDAVIALAHHADDQTETFILKLARGAGPDGLGGMPFFQTLENLRVIRPMLGIPRSEIVRWLENNGFGWREDSSNQDEAFLRNRVRHTILPLLENELNPNIRETILRTMDILREENAWMESLIAETKMDDLPSLPLAVRRRVLRKWLFENGAEGVDFDAVDKILSLTETANGTAYFELNDQQRVVVEYGKPRFEKGDGQPVEISWTLSTEMGTGWRKDHGKGAGILPADASFDAGKIGESPIEVRRFEPGDRMNPLGMEGGRKLQDIFTDQKIPRAQRSKIPVVVCRDEIIWIPGYRTARGWEVQSPNAKSVHVRIEQNRTL